MHPGYRPGKEFSASNAREGTFPRVEYVGSAGALGRFVDRFAGDRFVCASLNPRGEAFRNDQGYPRSARESEVAVSQNLLFDFDFETERVSHAQLGGLQAFLKRADEYFLDQGMRAPVKAYTGGGYHLLFAYAAVRVGECPDIRARLEVFREGFAAAFQQELGALEVKLDRTQDLRRMVRVYGTAKPGVGIVSKFFGERRVEDARLREYVLSLLVPDRAAGAAGGLGLRVGTELPAWFSVLVEEDEEVRQLWRGTDKPEHLDTSASGYDQSLMRRLLRLGYTDVAELATVLALRPGGSAVKHGKGESYIRRTIAAALTK